MTASSTRRKIARSSMRRVKRKTKHANRKLKYRLTKRKMMMGGGVTKIKKIDNQYANGEVTLTSKKIMFTNPKLIVEVNLTDNNPYDGDILHLLNSLLAQLSNNKNIKLELPNNIAVLDNPNFTKYKTLNEQNYDYFKKIKPKEVTNWRGASATETQGVYDKEGKYALEKFSSSLEPTKKPKKCTVVIELKEDIKEDKKNIQINKIVLSSLEAVMFRCVETQESPYYGGWKEYKFSCGEIPCWTISEKKEITLANPLILSTDGTTMDNLIGKFNLIKEIQLLETKEEEEERLNEEKQKAKEKKLEECGFTDLHNRFKPFITLKDQLEPFFKSKRLTAENFNKEGYDAIYTRLVGELSQNPKYKKEMETVLQTLFDNREAWKNLKTGCNIGDYGNDNDIFWKFKPYLQNGDKPEPATFESVSKKEFDKVFNDFNPITIAARRDAEEWASRD